TQPERVRASHILIAYEKGATPQQRKDAYSRIEAIKERIQAGEPFSALAKEYSDCPSGKDGGDLGFFARGDMVPEFENAAFSLNTGEMSGIVESEFGFHLILVTEREAESILPYDAVKSELESYLSEEKIQQAVLAFIDDLMKKANIKYYVNFGG
ncbi:MAG TPA: peptidyl-prolyl cis-trans isomerase, partial [Spirochaetia bacterium]|nr:peptidyl-prolyl cis-trans isomerase [Spirochaetia bacterium]